MMSAGSKFVPATPLIENLKDTVLENSSLVTGTYFDTNITHRKPL